MEGIIDDTILIVIGIVCSGVAGIVGGFFNKLPISDADDPDYLSNI